MLVTPIRPLWLLAGKMVPFFCIGLFDVLLVLVVGAWLFEVCAATRSSSFVLAG